MDGKTGGSVRRASESSNAHRSLEFCSPVAYHSTNFPFFRLDSPRLNYEIFQASPLHCSHAIVGLDDYPDHYRVLSRERQMLVWVCQLWEAGRVQGIALLKNELVGVER